MEQNKYENLLERTVVVQEGLLQAIDQLKNNSKEYNDKFALHCVITQANNKEITEVRAELLKYLKWSILALLIVLGGQQVVELLINYIK